jgi:penicillin-binding protein 2
MESKEISRRAFIMALLAAVPMGGLAYRLGSMQLVNGQRWEQHFNQQSMRTVDLFAPRGEILDVKGRRLATNRPAQAAYLVFPAYRDDALIRRICDLLQVDYQRVKARVQQKVDFDLYWEPVLVKDDITPAQYTAIVERRDLYAGVIVQTHPIREYPYGSLAAHVLGYVLEASEEDLKADPSLKPGALVGYAGLEARFDRLLRGRPGEKLVQVNQDYTPTGFEQITREVEPGKTLHLTIDAELQHTAERVLVRTLRHIQSTVIYDPSPSLYKNAKAGAVVAMDPQTGAILAMASYPNYDPNWFITGDERVSALFTDETWAPLFERAIRAHYNPASTWKMLTSLAGLHSGVIAPHEKIYCGGKFDKVEPPPKCWVWPSGHGHIDIEKALAGSCDVFFYELGMRLGVDRIVEMAKRFGFGRKTGVDLPREFDGWLPDEAARKELAELGTPWTPGETLFAAIGQKLSVTPLQLARYGAALASGGKILRPRLVAHVGDLSSDADRAITPDVVSELDLPKSFMSTIQNGMLAVTRAGGTAAGRFRNLPFPVAGKTGTAEVYGQDPHGVFLAYAPADNPKIVVAVFGEQAGHGDSMIPVVKAVIAKYMGVELPTNDEGYLPPEPLQPVTKEPA